MTGACAAFDDEPNAIPTEITIKNACADSRFVGANELPFQLRVDGELLESSQDYRPKGCDDACGKSADSSGRLLELPPGASATYEWSGLAYRVYECSCRARYRKAVRLPSDELYLEVPFRIEPSEGYTSCDPHGPGCNTYPDQPPIRHSDEVVLWSHLTIGGFPEMTDVYTRTLVSEPGKPIQIEFCGPAE
jgi:hypothetical protein